jgi:hypothetical protein
MAATLQINEFNGAGATKTASITNTNMGSADAVNLNVDTYPIDNGTNSFEKWQKIEVTAMGGASKINNIKVWRTGALNGATVHLTNARIASYGGAQVYSQPTASISSVATQTMPSSEPATANLGIAGSLAGELTAIGATDYLVHQLQSDISDVAGNTTDLNYQWDEVA